jgi:hypothetical protein
MEWGYRFGGRGVAAELIYLVQRCFTELTDEEQAANKEVWLRNLHPELGRQPVPEEIRKRRLQEDLSYS